MATALKSHLTNLKLNPNEFAEAVRESATRVIEAVQATLEKTQTEGRLALAKQVLKGAHRTNELSQALVILSAKIAPNVKTKAAPKAKPVAKKTVAAKPRARKTAA